MPVRAGGATSCGLTSRIAPCRRADWRETPALPRTPRLPLDALRQRTELVAEELGLVARANTQDSQLLVHLLALAAVRPACPASWLTGDDLTERRVTLEDVTHESQLHHHLSAELVASAGEGWRELPTSAGSDITQLIAELQTGPVPIHLDLDDDRPRVVASASSLQASATILDHVASSKGTILRGFGMVDQLYSLDRVEDLARLAQLIDSTTRPEPAWLSAVNLPSVEESVAVLGAHTADVRERWQRLSTVFKPTVADLDLPGLRARFVDVHRGIRKLGGHYRADGRAARCRLRKWPGHGGHDSTARRGGCLPGRT